MKIRSLVAIAGLSLTVNTFANSSDTATAVAFNPQQVSAIEAIVHQYLVDNPEVLIEASNALRTKMEQEQASNALAAIKKNKAELFGNNQTPFAGNPQGSEVIVEFFDYQCPHCKEMKTTMENLVKNNPNLKVYFRDWPIFGGASLTAAKAALAANLQGQYLAMHEALLAADNPLTDEKIDSIAKSLNLNLKKLHKDMQEPNTMNQINDTFALAKKLGLSGTPVFVLSNKAEDTFRFVPGSTSEEKLQALLAEIKAETE